MIKVKLYTDYKTQNIIFTMRGHAGAAPAGEDPVCAAATAYMWQFAEVVKGAEKQGWLIKKPRISIDEGKARITIRPKEQYVNTVNLLVTATATAFDWLAKQFPENVNYN